MSSFSGFSEADIRKLQNVELLPLQNTTNSGQKVLLTQKFSTTKVKGSKQEARKRMVLEKKINNKSATPVIELPNETRLTTSANENNAISQEEVTSSCSIPASTKNETPTSPTPTIVNENGKQIKTNTAKKMVDLNEFQTKQKLMEEQNRRRKEQVAKALEDRTKRTLQEQQKLVEIQDEFKKLDAHLSNDVKILRTEIESASYDYMEAQKRYHKIEKDFLDAKIFLHQKLEKKEMLTEHLCAIIEKNEERKADKLNELLQKLEVLDVESTSLQVEQITSNE